MIQLRTLTLLLAAGLAGSAWAQAPEVGQSPPALDTALKTPHAELAQPGQPQEIQANTFYAWDRVGRPIGKETFFI
jgi:hypothetical protein